LADVAQAQRGVESRKKTGKLVIDIRQLRIGPLEEQNQYLFSASSLLIPPKDEKVGLHFYPFDACRLSLCLILQGVNFGSRRTMINKQHRGLLLAYILPPPVVITFCFLGAWLGGVPSIRAAEPANTGAAALHLSPDGKFLYASNRANANELVIYSVDPQDGTLMPAGHQSSLGVKPRDFCIDPTGKFLVVANQDSDNLVTFKRDLEAGTLTPTGKPVEVGSPVCVQVVPVPEQ
jgi:hypothetical protein